MKFFKRNLKETEPAAVSVPATASPRFAGLSGLRNSGVEYELYSSLRESVPLIDAAIEKTVRLMGGFTVRTNEGQSALNRFLGSVGTCGGGRGIYPFVYAFVGDLLTYGQAVGEIVLTPDGRQIAALYNAGVRDVCIKEGASPLELVVCKNGITQEPVERQSLVMPVLLNPEPGTVKGTSILKGLPFVSGILLTVFNSIKTNWERVGNVKFAVSYKPGNGSAALGRQHAEQIAEEWSKAMKSGSPCDFVTVGDVSVSVIGADNQVLDCDVPIRHLLEQIVAKLSLPPFVLGLSWSSTERMSTQQADILTSELEYYRTLVTPVIERVCSLFLRLEGFSGECEVEWDNINLQDEVELASARLTNAQAAEIEKRTGVED